MTQVTSSSHVSTSNTTAAIAALQAQLAALQAAQQQALTASRTAKHKAAAVAVAKLQAALLAPPALTDPVAVAGYVAIAPKLARAQAALAKWGMPSSPSKGTGRGGLAGGPNASVNPLAKCNGGAGVVKAYKGGGAGPLGTTPGSKAACAVQCVVDAGPGGATMRDCCAAVAAQFGACNDTYRNVLTGLVKAGRLQVVPGSSPVRWATV